MQAPIFHTLMFKVNQILKNSRWHNDECKAYYGLTCSRKKINLTTNVRQVNSCGLYYSKSFMVYQNKEGEQKIQIWVGLLMLSPDEPNC